MSGSEINKSAPEIWGAHFLGGKSMSVSSIYLEARQHCDCCKCEGCPFETVENCHDALIIFEMLATN